MLEYAFHFVKTEYPLKNRIQKFFMEAFYGVLQMPL